MVCRLPARIGIAAVIRRNHQQILARKQPEKIAQQRVELFQRLRKPFDIFAMAIQHVEIHEVAKNQSISAFVNRSRQFLHSIGIRFCGDVLLHSAAIINVVNLADAEDLHTFFGKHVHQHRSRRIDRVIMSSRSARETSRRSRKRPCNYPSHAMWPVQKFPCDFAHAIKLRDRNHIFMRGNLKNAVAGRVHNRLARVHMLFTQLLDNLRSRRRLVADRLSPDPFLEGFNHITRESMFVHRESLIEPHSRHFPVAGCRVFSWRMGCSFAVCAAQFRRGR